MDWLKKVKIYAGFEGKTLEGKNGCVLPADLGLKHTKGLLKKAVSGVLAIFLCSRIIHTLRPQKWLRPC